MNKVKEDIKEEYQKYEVDGVESTDSPPIVATFLKFIPYNGNDNVYGTLYVKNNSVWTLEDPILRQSSDNKYIGTYVFYKDKNRKV